MLHNISNYRTGDLCTVESVLSLIYSQPVLYFFSPTAQHVRSVFQLCCASEGQRDVFNYI